MWFIFVLEIMRCAAAFSGNETWSPARRSMSFGPEFNGPITNVTAPIGREAVLTCSVTELKDYKIGWMRLADQTILSLNKRVITGNNRITVDHDDNLRKWQLRIRQLKESDRGCYMCQINTNPLRKQIGCIDVQVPPDIDDVRTSGDKSVTEGDNATLRCEASGHPQPRILWKREDGNRILLHDKSLESRKGNFSEMQLVAVETYKGSQLHLYNISRFQMGAYLCIASNDVPPSVSKRIILSVKYPPSVRVQRPTVGVLSGANANFECEVDAPSNSNNYWLKDMHLLNGTRYKVQERLRGRITILSLSVSRTSELDFGNYSCVSRNELGEAQGNVTLFEIEPTTTPSTQQPPESTTIAELPWIVFKSGGVKEVVSIDNVTEVADIPDNFLHPSLAPRQMELEIHSGCHSSINPERQFVVMLIFFLIFLQR